MILGVVGAALLFLCAETVKELPMEETEKQLKEQLDATEGLIQKKRSRGIGGETHTD